MERKIRVGTVNYLNTRPLLYGFEQGMMADRVELLGDYPSRIAEMLLSDEIDIGLVPVAVLPQLPGYRLISDYGIGCSSEVASVCLFSDVPLNEIRTILLDYQSRTSVALLKILLKEYWNISPELLPAVAGYENDIRGNTAGLVIGDRALKQRKQSAFIYDLAKAWRGMTGLPFLFAAWVSNKPLPPSFEQEFNRTTGEGLQHIAEIVAALDFPDYDLLTYYTSNIDYRLDEPKRKALRLFLSKLNNG